MPSGGGERTEKATPKRLRDEREQGNVFLSGEIVPLVGLLAVLYTLQFLSPFILGAITKGFDTFLSHAASLDTIAVADLRPLFMEGAAMFAVAAVPAVLVAILVAVAVTMAQTKGLVSGKAVQPQFNRLNPLNGLKKIISLRGLVELLKAIVKILVLGYVIYNKFVERFGELPRLMEMDFIQVLPYTAAFLMDIVTSVASIYIFVVAADYLYQRWQYEKDLRMTKEEVKEEYKQTEGSPQIKGRIKQKQREMAMSRMMQSVPEADVIIRNPTHYAVAIRYTVGTQNAPTVLAKGADLVALRIIKLGEENDVMIVENRPLAKSLFDTVAIDNEIPADFYQAVAEVLAYVYSVEGKNPAAPH